MVLAIITFTVLLIYLVNHTGVFINFIFRILSIIFPFLLGCGIAFVINIPMRGIETHLFKNEKSKLYKCRRAISMLIAYLFAILVIAIVVFVMVPDLADTVAKVKDLLPDFVEKSKKTITGYTEKYPEITKKIMSIDIDWDKITGVFTDKSGAIVTTTVAIFSSIIGAVINTLIGIVFSMYILASKEKLGRQTKMIIYSVFKEKTADEIMVFGKIANTTFSKFFTCQFREGIILGTMFFLAMTVIGMPYAVTIGVIIAFTALIPVFGAFIGLFIGIFLLLVAEPSMVIWFIVLFFGLQFIENYFIYPRLVGGDIGLSAIWVLLAVIVGGDLMGVVGMFIFIPLVSVIYAYTRSLIYRKLDKKAINIDEKQVSEDVMPLMESRRRMFSPKAGRKNKSKTNTSEISDETNADEEGADL